MPNAPEQDMSFWGHLEALRSVVIKIAAVLCVLSIAYFAAMPWIFNNVITAPCTGDFVLYRALASLGGGDGSFMPKMAAEGFSVQLINIELASQFMIHMSASMWAAFATAFPIIVYLLWSFIAPGLYPHEKKGAKGAFLWGNIMFYAGMAVGYFLVFPLALRFLADYQLSSKIASTVSLTSYMDTFYTILLVMGALFELPIAAWLLGKAGILHRSFFRKYRRHAIAVLLVAAGILTPTSDIFTLLIVFLPVYTLWECSALLIPKRTDPLPLLTPKA